MVVKGSTVESKEVVKGIKRQILAYNKELMVCRFTLEKGAVLPEHGHINLQTSYIISGKLGFTIDGEEKILEAGDNLLLEKNVKHGVIALEETVVLDIFTPMREDFL